MSRQMTGSLELRAEVDKKLVALELKLILSDNVPIAALVAVYIAVLYAVHTSFGIHGKIILIPYFDLFTRLAIVISCIFLIPQVLKKNCRVYFSPRYLAGFLAIFLLAPLFTSAFASYKQTFRLIHNFRFDMPLMRLDRYLHFGHDPWRLLQPVLDYAWILRALDVLYMLWFLALALVCLWMAWTVRRRLRACFFVSTLLVWILLGSGMGTLLSSAGPCYFSRVVKTAEDPFGPLTSKLHEIHASAPLHAVSNQEGLWKANEEGFWLPFGGISAMPSIHLAMAAVFVLLAFEVRRWFGFIMLAYLILLLIGSVILGWHYAVDGYAGILLTCLIWCCVRRVVPRII